MKFPATIDAWVVCLIATGALVIIGIGVFFIYIARSQLQGVAGGLPDLELSDDASVRLRSEAAT